MCTCHILFTLARVIHTARTHFYIMLNLFKYENVTALRIVLKVTEGIRLYFVHCLCGW